MWIVVVAGATDPVGEEMRTELDCVPCLMAQSLDASRHLSDDPAFHERTLEEMLRWTLETDRRHSPPVLGQRLHAHLRAVTGEDDPYRRSKDRQNELALGLLPELHALVAAADDPFELAVRIAVAGNVIDLGINRTLTEADVHHALEQALAEPVAGPLDELRAAAESATDILYLADNCGEIVFDQLLVEQLTPERVTVAVRGAPILNDATLMDAETTGMTQLVEVIDNGSDAPGTLLDDCSLEFRQRFESADLVIAKGQGNYESLGEAPRPVYSLFKVKCSVVAGHVGLSMGTAVLSRIGTPSS